MVWSGARSFCNTFTNCTVRFVPLEFKDKSMTPQQKAAMRSKRDMAPQCDGVTMGAASSQHARRHDARSRTPLAENQASQVARVALAGLSFGTAGAGRGAACCQRRAEVFFGMRSAERGCPAGMVSEARCAS